MGRCAGGVGKARELRRVGGRVGGGAGGGAGGAGKEGQRSRSTLAHIRREKELRELDASALVFAASSLRATASLGSTKTRLRSAGRIFFRRKFVDSGDPSAGSGSFALFLSQGEGRFDRKNSRQEFLRSSNQSIFVRFS